MNRIIETQMNQFCDNFQISRNKDIAVRFEHFVNYCVFLNACPSAYDTTRDAYLEVHTGSGGDSGIDGVLILINDTPVFSCEEVKNLIENKKHKSLEVEFIFTQAKTSSCFDSGEMLKTREGVLKFFSSEKMKEGKLDKFKEIQELIYSHSICFHENPKCYIYYVTTGKWEKDPNLSALVEDAKKALLNTDLFSNADFIPVDNNSLQKLFKNLSTTITKQINFEKKQSFPQIKGTSQSFIGLVEGKDFVELISIDGRLNKTVFYENVRAFLGENSVNKEISKTLEDEDNKERFSILNNGVTIVARELNLVGDKLTLHDFQIVNGCQTSYVLYSHRGKLDGVMVPVKIIASEDQEVINMIIRSTNRQTVVTAEAFESIKEIQKGIQDYYNTFSSPDRLYYERRTREYDRINATNINRNQVFTIPMQVMSHADMFLNKPHEAINQYYGELLKDNAKVLFQKDDLPIVYYTSARTLFKVEQWIKRLTNKALRTKIKEFRIPLILIIRILIQGSSRNLPPMNSHKMESLCNKILQEIENQGKFENLMSKAIDVLLECAAKAIDQEEKVDQRKLTEKILNYFYVEGDFD